MTRLMCVLMTAVAVFAVGQDAVAQRHGWAGSVSSPGHQVGLTYQDLQHNTRMARQIVIGAGWVRNVWTYLPGPGTADRTIQYYAWQIGGPGSVFNGGIEPLGGEGYSAIDYDPSPAGAAVVTYHRPNDATYLAREVAPGTAAFLTFAFPTANCSGLPGEGTYLWPYMCTDTDNSGNPIAHVVSTEAAPSGSPVWSIVYYRATPGITGPGATCAAFIDSCDNLSAVVCQSPNSDAVAIVYTVPTDHAFTAAQQQRNQDVAFRESSDLGTSWGPSQSITDFTGADKERAFADLNAIYTSDDCLHVVWTALFFDSVAATFSDQQCRLYHWDNCAQCRSLLNSAYYTERGCQRGSWQANISRVMMSQCLVDGPNRLYVTYTQFLGSDTGDPGGSDCSLGGYANGELMLQTSQSNGLTWGRPVNLTNTATPGCTAGGCASENWASAAMFVTDSLRIQYLVDLDAGRASGSEGTWTNNPVMNLAVPCLEAESFSKLVVPDEPFNYMFFNELNTSRDTLIMLRAFGNANISYSVSVRYLFGPVGWVSFPGQPSPDLIPISCSAGDTVVMRVTSPSAPTTDNALVAYVDFIYNDGANVDTQTVTATLLSFCCLSGDADGSFTLSISDAVYLINYIFAGGPHPMRECLGDADCNCTISISDAVWLIQYIFAGGPPPEPCCAGCDWDW